MAESGGRYAIPQVLIDAATAKTNLDGKTFTFSDGNSFTLAIDNSNPTYTLVTSAGGIHTGGWFKGARTIHYNILKPFADNFTESSAAFNQNWAVLNYSQAPAPENTGGINTVNLKPASANTGVIMTFNWATGTNTPDLVSWRNAGNGLLSYGLQAKYAVNIGSSTNEGRWFMIGLSFRVSDTAETNEYGLSYFKANNGTITSGSDKAPTWVTALPSTFYPLMDTSGNTISIILWLKKGTTFSLLGYQKLGTSTGGVTTTFTAGGKTVTTLKNYSTLALKVYEENVSGTTTTRNKIYGYYANPSIYPPNTTPQSWDLDNVFSNLFNKVSWSGTTTSYIYNSSLTTAGFGTSTPEVGSHFYYDSTAGNKLYITDFGMEFLGAAGAGFVGFQY